MGTRLTGKTCFVTAAGQGIGRGIAQQFAAEGARVIATDLRFDDGAPAEDRISRRILDARDERAVVAVAAEHPDISVLVNCVGVVANGALLDCSLEEFDRSMSVNVRTMAITCRAFLPGMLRRQHGSIINVASVVSCVMAAPNRVRLRNQQGGRDRTHDVYCARLRQPRRPLQRDQPRNRRHTVLARKIRGFW
jgi:2-keto-3-deoxy-L-fuconate dehydrogenase